MSTTNLVLTSIDSSSLVGGQGMYYEWKETTLDGTKEVFAVRSSNGAWGYSDLKHSIAVVKATDTWIDYGYSHPSTTNDSGPLGISSSGTEIHISDSTFSNWYKFTKPTASTGAWWITSSINTLSVVPTEFTTSVPSGVTPFDDVGPELYLTIAKTEASGQYNIYLDDVYYTTATHTNGSVSSSQVAGRSFALNAKLYFGQVFTSSSLNTLVTEFTWPTRKKKGHSNFW